jgi:hypothetical protein
MPINKPQKKNLLFLLSVDTEEEFDWSGEFPQQDCSVENIQRLPKFQQFCETLGIRPTYLIDYPVASDSDSTKILRAIAESNKAEIGAHLHPWCTPPLEGENGEKESHVINLPIELVKAKLATLTTTIEDNIGIKPRSFRTGRWGINGDILRLVSEAGYTVDSSIYPYYSNQYFSCDKSHNLPYWPDINNPDKPGAQRHIFELPITSGFNRSSFPFWGKVHRALSSPALNTLHPIGLAWRSNILRKLYLSPELSSTRDMIALANAAIKGGHTAIHMYLHSSTLLPGKNEFTTNEEDEEKLYRSIKNTVMHLTEQHNITFCTLSEATERLKPIGH